MAQPPTATQAPSSWDAAQYESALAQLTKLQEQLDGLRSAIPSIVAPLTRPSNNKPQLFGEIKKAAVGATDNLKTFRETWSQERTKEVFVRGKESFEKDGDLRKAEGVERWGWDQRGDEER